ncbi:MAG: GNAT family N-acetyltransferase [Phormidesmis sp.]
MPLRKPDNLTIRALQIADEPTLWTMLMYAAHESSLVAVKSNPALSRYVQAWGRSGDLGAIAEQGGIPVGAVWLRLWSADDRGYGYVADEIPELAIAVVPTSRGSGVGTALLKKILQMAKSEFSAISLSIRSDNPALRLYERAGFKPVPGSEVINREGGRSFTMRIELER